jgi:hypothetical protein
MAFIFPAPGVTNTEMTLEIRVAGDTSALTIPAVQDITINNANDVFTWTQLDEGSKLQIPTTATNSIDTNIVLDQTIFFGDGVSSNVAINKGIFGLSKDKQLVSFAIFLGKTSTGGTGKNLTGTGYITGLAPTVSADAPVWVSPVTITVTGDYTEVPA